MQHLHISWQSKERRDILPPKYDLAAMRRKGGGNDHHHLYHVQQLTPYSRDNHDLHLNDNGSGTLKPQPCHSRQVLSPQETVHCCFCPHFRGHDRSLKKENVESNAPLQHHKNRCHNEHESQCTHLQSRPRSPDSSVYEEPIDYTGRYHTQKLQTNERPHHAPKPKHFHPKGSKDLFDRGHHHNAPQVRGTCAGATVCKSQEDRCGSNPKAVRFGDDMMPEYTATRHPNCSIHHIPSPVESQCHSHCNTRHRQSQSRESRTYRWVWGPPLPTVVPRHGKIYYAENY